MTDNNGTLSGSCFDSINNPTFIMTELSYKLLKTIEDILAELVARTDLSPCDYEFYEKYRILLDHCDRFQNEIINASGINSVCSAGCSHCCCHWVDDVNSFEGVIISRYLSEYHPDKVDCVMRSFHEDAEVFDSLSVMVEQKLSECSSDSEEVPDPYDLLLSCFYQMERPCALLDDNGRCIVYPVRPLTCRDYLNVRHPDACLPERINEESEATMIMYLSDTVSGCLEILHRRFDEGRNEMSLRILLAHLLKLISGE